MRRYFNKSDVEQIIEAIFNQIRKLRAAGQAEYAHDDERPFRNFEEVAEELGISREKVWAAYARKHWDGILAYIKGHRSQRESVKGRILDEILYMCLLYAMVEEDELCESIDSTDPHGPTLKKMSSMDPEKPHYEEIQLHSDVTVHLGHGAVNSISKSVDGKIDISIRVQGPPSDIESWIKHLKKVVANKEFGQVMLIP